MQTTDESIKELEAKLAPVKEGILKIDELMRDIKNCSGDTTKSLILQAVRKYASPIVEFKF